MQAISSAVDPIQQSFNFNRHVFASALGTLINNDFTGEPTGRNSDVSQIQVTYYVPLGASVSSKLKLKTWSKKNIDMKSMLPFSSEKPHSIMVKAGKIELKQSSSSKILIIINLPF